jgi:hypothetical protein
LKTNSHPIIISPQTGLDFKDPAFNIGATYKSPAGTTGLAFNNKGLVTVNHAIAVDKNLSLGVEFVQPTQNNARKGGNIIIIVFGSRVRAALRAE